MTTPLLPLAALAAGVFYFASRGQKKLLPITLSPPASSGRVWATRMISNTGSGTAQRIVTQLFAPPQLFGNATRMLVVTYVQEGADKSARTIVSVGPNVTPEMLDAAGKDFHIRKKAA